MAAKPTKPLTDSGGHVRVVPGKSVPTSKSVSNSGLENRGAKPTANERINRARDLQWNKAEKNYDSDTRVAGYKGGPNVNPQGPKGKNLRQSEAIKLEASKKLPIKIRSNQLGGQHMGGHAPLIGGAEGTLGAGGGMNWETK